MLPLTGNEIDCLWLCLYWICINWKHYLKTNWCLEFVVSPKTKNCTFAVWPTMYSKCIHYFLVPILFHGISWIENSFFYSLNPCQFLFYYFFLGDLLLMQPGGVMSVPITTPTPSIVPAINYIHNNGNYIVLGQPSF